MGPMWPQQQGSSELSGESIPAAQVPTATQSWHCVAGAALAARWLQGGLWGQEAVALLQVPVSFPSGCLWITCTLGPQAYALAPLTSSPTGNLASLP